MSIYSKEFKIAISQLSSTEKDKLILRLLKKDLALTRRLMFELVSTDSVDELRLEMEKHIETRVAEMAKYFKQISYLFMSIRYLSGEISEHVKTTKDKYGDVSLNLLLLIEVLRQNKANILAPAYPSKIHKFSVSIIARVYKVLLLIQKLDEDLHLDFKEDLSTLGSLIADNPIIMKTAIHNGLDLNWLIKAEIPEKLVAFHKDLRAKGFLK